MMVTNLQSFSTVNKVQQKNRKFREIHTFYNELEYLTTKCTKHKYFLKILRNSTINCNQSLTSDKSMFTDFLYYMYQNKI